MITRRHFLQATYGLAGASFAGMWPRTANADPVQSILSSELIASNASGLTTKIPGQLTACSYSEFKPISYGNGLGYEADLLKKFAKSIHLKIKFYPESIYEQLWAMPSKEYTLCDVAIGGFSETKSREEQGAVFSLPTLHFSQSLLVRTNEASQFKAIRDFAGKKIGVVPGTTGALYAIERLKEADLDWNRIIVDYRSEAQLIPALQNNKIDAIARGEIGNEYQAKLHPYFKVILKKNFGESFRIVVNKHNPTLLKLLNKYIREHVDVSENAKLKLINKL